MNVAAPNLDPKELAELWRRMHNSAGAGAIPLPAADAEDVTQEAMLRLVQEEEREGAPPLIARGLRLLRQAKIEHVRRRNRAKEPKFHVVGDDEPEPSRLDAALRLVELEDVIRREVGEDGLEAARGRVARETETELGSRPGWTPERAHAARRRLLRGRERLLDQLLDDD
jgi:DNA-directed RNA polymerase specialized sigma24 family protein